MQRCAVKTVKEGSEKINQKNDTTLLSLYNINMKINNTCIFEVHIEKE